VQPGEREVRQYTDVLEELNFLWGKKSRVRDKFGANSDLLGPVESEIESREEEKISLETKFPGLIAISPEPGSSAAASRPLMDLQSEQAELLGLEARVAALKSQLGDLDKLFQEFISSGTRMASLERRKKEEEEKLDFLNSSLDRARVNEALDPSSMPNLSEIQKPSVPMKAASDMKTVLMIAGSGVALGLGWALLIEMFLDRTVKRAAELEQHFHIPLMLSIPYINGRERRRLIASSNGHRNGSGSGGNGERDENGEVIEALAVNGKRRPSHWSRDLVGPYCASLRDRLVYYFELNNLLHKPKLIALTGFAEGAGTSTLAAGLASAMAEAEDGKVLLVDMASDHAGGESLLKGERLGQKGGFDSAGAGQENLHFATLATGINTSKPFAARQLYELLPRFRSSDYDYIIFDMPPISSTSPTVPMAGLMDKVLLIVDAEKTGRDVLARGHAQLVAGRADVSCILNRTRSRLPKWIADPDLAG
jgi:Mrp family chromosome partitioning ATPase